MNFKNKNILIYIFVFLTIFLFIGLKLINPTFRFGDNNVYFYMAKAVLDGNVPYKDFFLADPPVLVLLLTGLRIIFGNCLIFYQLLPIFFEIATAILLFLILKKENNFFAFLAPLFYLFSFSVLATSDFLTGVQLVIFFSILGIFFWKKEKPFLSGFFWAMSCLVKLYALPAFLGFIIFIVLLRNKKALVKFILGAVVPVAIFIVPFLFIDFSQVFKQLIVIHFNRPVGLSKVDVFGFLLFREWLLIALAFLGMYFSRKKEFFLPFIFTLIFLLLFQDIYFAYFGSIIAYLVLFSIFFLNWLWLKYEKSKNIVIFLIIIYCIFILISMSYYQYAFFNYNRFTNAQEVADFVKTLPKNTEIYGSHEMTPLVALLSQRQIFGNYIETNPQGFKANALNLEEVSEKAVEAGIYLIAQISDIPSYNIKDFGYQGYFSQSVFEKYCQRVKSFSQVNDETITPVVIYKCFKNE